MHNLHIRAMIPWRILCVINLKKVFKFNQKCAKFTKNSSRGVMQMEPKTIVMVPLKSLKFRKEWKSKWVNQKGCYFIKVGISCHERGTPLGEHGEGKDTNMAWGLTGVS